MTKDKNYISAIKRPGLLYGAIVRSEIPSGTIVSIDLPDFPKDIQIISSKDIPGSNAVKVLNTTLPLLASETVTYKGQPILAVFAPSSEAAQSAAGYISINYTDTKEMQLSFEQKFDDPDQTQENPAITKIDNSQPKTDEVQVETDKKPDDPDSDSNQITEDVSKEILKKVIKWGNPDKLFAEADSIIEQTYITGPEESPLTAPTGALAEFINDKLIVHAATQWPFHVRNVVSEVCGVNKRKVTVYQTGYHPTHDEKLIYPSIYGALCAIAAIKTGQPARLICSEPSYRPESAITRKTALNSDQEPMAEIIDIQINMGAYAFFAEEMIRQIAAGAVPLYDIEGIRITIRLLSTPTPPRHHFRGLGFSSAMYSAEAHASHITMQTQSNPLVWRLKHLKSSKSRPGDQTKIKYALLKELLEHTAKRSDFYRKHAVYEMQRQKQQNLSPFFRYARGIGIACGYGINGFSKAFSEEKKHSITVTLEVNNAVTVSLSIFEPEAEKIWKSIISEALGVDTSKITIEYGDTAHVPDTGPDVLRREIHHISSLIDRCCDSIKSQRFKEPLPIKVKRGFKLPADLDTKRQLFSGLSWGSVIIELEIDTITLEPIIKGAWGSFDCGRIFLPEKLASALTKSFHEGINRCGGAQVKYDRQPLIDIFIKEVDAGLPTSATETAYGLIAAAYTAAVSQALNSQAASLPFGPGDILKILEHGSKM
ncbi:MAG: xanthine dehydrogenase family protein molybdopterin-binding subunit [Bacteroidetes bacterium]|nr:xanthine dehydrogenase family protein molybdopterin-binding subunit [Bacteroidota bacterium]